MQRRWKIFAIVSGVLLQAGVVAWIILQPNSNLTGVPETKVETETETPAFPGTVFVDTQFILVSNQFLSLYNDEGGAQVFTDGETVLSNEQGWKFRRACSQDYDYAFTYEIPIRIAPGKAEGVAHFNLDDPAAAKSGYFQDEVPFLANQIVVDIHATPSDDLQSVQIRIHYSFQGAPEQAADMAIPMSGILLTTPFRAVLKGQPPDFKGDDRTLIIAVRPFIRVVTAEEEAERKLTDQLDEVIEGSLLEADGQPLESLLRDLACKNNVNINVDWTALKTAGAENSTPVKLQLPGPMLEAAFLAALDAAHPTTPLALAAIDGEIYISTAPRVQAARNASGARNLLRHLETRTIPAEWNVKDEEIDRLLDELGEQCNVVIRTDWKKLQSVGIEKTTKVTLHLNDITLKDAIREILSCVKAKAPLDFAQSGGIIRISTVADLRFQP